MNKIYRRYAESKPRNYLSAIQRYYIGEDKEPIDHYICGRKENYPNISDKQFKELSDCVERGITRKLDDIFKDLR